MTYDDVAHAKGGECRKQNSSTVNPVNTDIKETGHSVRIIRVSVLSGLLEKMSGTHILRPKQAVLRENVV